MTPPCRITQECAPPPMGSNAVTVRSNLAEGHSPSDVQSATHAACVTMADMNHASRVMLALSLACELPKSWRRDEKPSLQCPTPPSRRTR
jgi:hypothetical protein